MKTPRHETVAERCRRYRNKKKSAGLIKLSIWVTPDQAEAVKAIVNKMNADSVIKET